MVWECQKCNKKWYYPVDKCIFCDGDVVENITSEYTVKGITEVSTPSTHHSKVPYYDLLLEDLNGNLRIHKTFQKYEIGDQITDSKEINFFYKIGVIGTGVTGSGIVQVALESGFDVVLKSRTDGGANKAVKKVEKWLLKSLSDKDVKKKLEKIQLTTDFKELASADIVIESVIEDIGVKKDMFKLLDEICSKDTVLATNTSSLSIDRIASATSNPERVIGMHFFNPIPKMNLVEIVAGNETSNGAIEFVTDLTKSLNKTPVVVKDTPGFIVNRLLFSMINEAVYLVMEESATIENIDTAMRLGANHPIGPLALADFIGVDLCLEIIKNLNISLGDKKFKKPCPIFYDMIKKGHFGRKSGKGFYEY